jgi:hypothetical protein
VFAGEGIKLKRGGVDLSLLKVERKCESELGLGLEVEREFGRLELGGCLKLNNLI